MTGCCEIHFLLQLFYFYRFIIIQKKVALQCIRLVRNYFSNKIFVTVKAISYRIFNRILLETKIINNIENYCHFLHNTVFFFKFSTRYNIFCNINQRTSSNIEQKQFLYLLYEGIYSM